MTVRYIVQYALQIFILAVFRNYYAYLVALPLMVIPNSIANYVAARKQYPDIVCRGTPAPEIKESVYHRVKTLFGHKVGNTLMVNVDSILITAFLGLSLQSLYSNYYYIVTAVNGVVEILTAACLAGIGNKLITDPEEENHTLFLHLSYGWVALIGFCAACMLCLFQPFVGGIWIGQEGLLSESFVIFMTLFFYSWMFRIMQLTYRDASGLWTRDWLKPYVSMALKLILSVVLVKLTDDIIGVLLPTILVMFFVYFPWEAKVLYKYQFRRGWGVYLKRILLYTLINAVGAAGCYFVCLMVSPANTALSFLIRLALVAVLFPLVWLVTTGRSHEFRYCFGLAKTYLLRRKGG